MLPIEHLIPLRAVNITLQFINSAYPRLFHHLALTAWLRHLIGDVPNYEHYITLDAPESGRVSYKKGDFYRFTLFALNGGEKLLQHILNCLFCLPKNVKIRDKEMPFRDNLIFHEAHDLFTNEPISSITELSPYTFNTLQQETDIWYQHDQCWVNWISPVRLLLPKSERGRKNDEKRFFRHHSQVDFAILNDRVYDTLAGLLRQQIDHVPSRITDETKRLIMADVFWMDYSYYSNQGNEKQMGGLLGRLVLDTENMPLEQWLYWVLGQYVGIGQRRSFGWGRYQLESAETGRTIPRSSAMVSLLELACRQDNLEKAYKEISEDKIDVKRLIHLRKQLLHGEYRVPTLHKQTLKRKDGSTRLLQAPPFFDQVAQRAVAHVLIPALDALMYSGGLGFRHGQSQYSAIQIIQRIFELNIEDFFDNIQWPQLYTRLTAFFGNDPVVDLMMGWMTASVEGEEREAGLPRGSPLSSLLATIMLDDF
jgi:hypothetical protein